MAYFRVQRNESHSKCFNADRTTTNADRTRDPQCSRDPKECPHRLAYPECHWSPTGWFLSVSVWLFYPDAFPCGSAPSDAFQMLLLHDLPFVTSLMEFHIFYANTH